MKAKFIKSILTKKINEWIESIEDEEVKKLVKNNTIVTGGAIVNLLLNEEVKDYDVYFTNKETVKAVAKYYVKKFQETRMDNYSSIIVVDGIDVFNGVLNGSNSPSEVLDTTPDRIKIVIKSAGVAAENAEVIQEPFEDVCDALEELTDKEEVTKTKYRPVFLSPNAITLSDKVQLVIRFYGDADKIHENYDFVHCTNYFEYHNKNLVLRPQALEAILTKELLYIGSKYPICSIIRTRKFIKRGWNINAGQYLKMLYQVSKLDLNDINVLRDQLIGVDSAYFNHLIDALQSKNDVENSFELNYTYLATIIDRIF